MRRTRPSTLSILTDLRSVDETLTVFTWLGVDVQMAGRSEPPGLDKLVRADWWHKQPSQVQAGLQCVGDSFSDETDSVRLIQLRPRRPSHALPLPDFGNNRFVIYVFRMDDSRWIKWFAIATAVLTTTLVFLTIVLATYAWRLDVLTHSLVESQRSNQPSSPTPEQSPTPTPTAAPILKAIPIATPTLTPSPSPHPTQVPHRRHPRRHR